MSTLLEPIADAVVCHCLQISSSEIKTAAGAIEAPTVRCIMKCTGAGTGCTACHRRIRRLIEDQCPAGSSPTCVIR